MHSIFEAQKAHQEAVAATTAAQRQEKLRRLHDTVLRLRPAIREALHKDFRRHPTEVDLTEVYPVTNEVKHALKHLPRWMRPQKVGTPLALFGSRSYVLHEPKGQALIISPWNFPVMLSLGPLVSAVAAGNTVMLKPSEHTPHSAGVIRQIVQSVFEEREVAVIEGGVETSTALLELPFHHIFFTGAPSVGKVVMRAAAEHLASVTLELGGKSPTIVDETADIARAARRIAWAKWMNNGQVCIAPDYLLVHESRAEELVNRVSANLRKFYGDDASKSRSYARIVNDRHFSRVARLVDTPGARVLVGGRTSAAERYVGPTILTDVPLTADVMNEEIFGPVLPVFRFQHLDEALEIIRAREKPLALYLYTQSEENAQYVLKHTRAGGTCINHSGVHFFNNDLPFGGSNHSGLGKSHGFYGFQAFSNQRGVLQQWAPFSAIELMMPPYGRLKQKLVDLTIRFF